mgnify:CR=1 FL=1
MYVVWNVRELDMVVPISVEMVLSVLIVMLALAATTSGMPAVKPTVKEVLKVLDVDHVCELDTD